MWGLAAEGIRLGQLPEVLPVYPGLTAILAMLLGASAWQVGGWLSLVAGSLLPAAIALVGRRLGLGWATVLPVALVSLVLPDLLLFSWQLQPDALATLLLLGVLAAGIHYDQRPGPARAVLWVGAALALAATREHGGIVLPVVLLALVGYRWPRVGAALAVVAGLAGLVLATGVLAAWLPERLAMPLRESPLAAGTGPLPSYADELGGEAGRALAQAWTDGDRLGVWWALLERLLTRSGGNLLLLALGGVGWVVARRRRSLPALVALSPLGVLLIIWSHRRHTSVLLPVALLGVALLVEHLLRKQRARQALSAVLLLLLGGLLALGTPAEVRGLAGAARHGHERLELARWMRSQPGEWFLGGQHNEVNLHLVWYRHNPELPPPSEPMPLLWEAADWRTQWVAPPGTMPPPFSQVHVGGSLAVYSLQPEPGQERPCAQVRPVGDVIFTSEPVQGRVSQACQAPPHFGTRPPPPEHPWEGQPFVPPEAGK